MILDPIIFPLSEPFHNVDIDFGGDMVLVSLVVLVSELLPHLELLVGEQHLLLVVKLQSRLWVNEVPIVLVVDFVLRLGLLLNYLLALVVVTLPDLQRTA